MKQMEKTPIKNLTEIEKIIKTLKKELARIYNVKAIGIFGSFVHNEQTEESDIDILVEFSEPIGFFKFLELEEYLSDQIGLKVDLVTKKALKPYIGRSILKEVVMV